MNNSIQIIVSDTGVMINNSRSNAISNVLIGKNQSQALVLLHYVLTLCPIAQMATLKACFDALKMNTPYQQWFNLSEQYHSKLSQLSQLEAILETIRFFTIDFKNLLTIKDLNKSLLQGIGHWRAELFSSFEKNNSAEELILLQENIRQFSKSWYEQFEHNFLIIEDYYSHLTTLTPITSQNLLKPERIHSGDFLNYFVNQIKQNHNFCFSPNDIQPKVVGSLARSQSFNKSVFTPNDLIKSRIQELRDFVDGGVFDSQLGLYRQSENQVLCHIETARGVLFHFYEINNGRIDLAKIIAPTEWAFQNLGVLPFWLNQYYQHSLKSPVNTQERDLKLIANAFDACTTVTVVRKDEYA